MTVAAPFPGPVSAALEADLREFARRHGVVVWLDLDDHYSAFVDRLAASRPAGSLPFGLQAFRGSHLALMLSLEGVAGGVDPVPLVIHMPGFNEESIRDTPLLELYEAGKRYRKALETLVTEAAAGRVPPADIAAFTSQPGLSLDAADAWLEARLAERAGGVSARLQAMEPTAVFDDLLSGGPIASGLAQGDDERAIWDRFGAWTGLALPWREATHPAGRLRPADLAFVAASWVLAVEFVDDLKRSAVNPLLSQAHDLPRPVIDQCRAIAVHLRERHADFYQHTADETELVIADEVEAARAADLGKVDTFRFEEARVLEGALEALAAGAWDVAAAWAAARVDSRPTAGSFWLRRDPSRQAAWQLVDAAACLGRAVARASGGLLDAETIDAGVDAYVDRGAPADQAHRLMEQRRAALLHPQIPEFELLRARLDEMRGVWQRWADDWGRRFNALCRAHGFLPAASRQQRTLFDEVVRPLTQDAGITALFLVDGLRYEMGQELRLQLAEAPATTVQLRARLAELPTVTEVGMNVLVPVATAGRLSPAMTAPMDGARILGFSTGEFRVSDPDSRKRAMHARVGGASCPWFTLEEVLDRESGSLRRAVAQSRLVVVHSRDIDNAGEAGVTVAVFDSLLQKIRAAWRLLRDAGVRRFVFTGDHGFLLRDDQTGSTQAHGRRVDPQRRYVFTSVPADRAGEVRVPLADLAYDGVDGHVVFPETTAVFDTGRSGGFVHGGNSLQERVIPVLTVQHRAAAGGSTVQYTVEARALEEVAGMHCLEVTTDVAQGALDFGSARTIELSLRVPDSRDVRVELCQTRGEARLSGGAILAAVGERFELFFRLSGPSEARVRVEVGHASGTEEVRPCVPDTRFAVAAVVSRDAGASVVEPGPSWLDQLPEGGVRQVFEHLAAHGTITETEAAAMLGGPRAVRRFALQFEELVRQAPWNVHIEVVAGIKRYVREGGRG